MNPVMPVYIFRGKDYEGISYESFSSVKTAIGQIFGTRIVEWDHNTMPPSCWDQKGLCVFPGGECSKWKGVLSSTLQGQIANWLNTGGKILGICAGAYFCSEKSSFKVHDQKIKAIRTIAVFQGICRGPLLPSPVDIVKVTWMRTKENGYVAIVKGGELVPREKESQSILALCEKSIVVIKSKKGVLSTVHFEFNKEDVAPLISYLPHLKEKLSLLDQSLSFRQACFKEMYAEAIN